jgi:hypothetical protein
MAMNAHLRVDMYIRKNKDNDKRGEGFRRVFAKQLQM